jgi:hypothetical protein
MHRGLIAARKSEGGRQHEVATMMKDRIVVTEAHVLGPHGLSLTLFGEDLA